LRKKKRKDGTGDAALMEEFGAGPGAGVGTWRNLGFRGEGSPLGVSPKVGTVKSRVQAVIARAFCRDLPGPKITLAVLV
jgi:hypothetical protein